MAEDRSKHAHPGDAHRVGNGGLVHCDECMKQIPTERAVKSETEDYVRHICGLDCLRRWERARGP
jgi:ribosomal protein S26